jgi:hypothetical protein
MFKSRFYKLSPRRSNPIYADTINPESAFEATNGEMGGGDKSLMCWAVASVTRRGPGHQHTDALMRMDSDELQSSAGGGPAPDARGAAATTRICQWRECRVHATENL